MPAGDTQSRDKPARGGQGRPRRFVPPKKLPHLPLDEPLQILSPTAQSLLEAGRRILEEKGVRALTLEAVAFEAGASKSTLLEHFGNRAVFLTILLDSLMQDESVELARDHGVELGLQEDGPGRVASVEAAIGSLASLYTDLRAVRAYHEIVGVAMHDEAFRLRLACLFRWYRCVRLDLLTRSDGAEACTADELELLATLVAAAEDGLSLKRAIDPGLADLEREMDLLGRLVSLFIAQKAAERQGGED